jgi:hypothetical protein
VRCTAASGQTVRGEGGDVIPDDPARRGYDAELRRHRPNLIRALNEVREVVGPILRDVVGGGNAVTSETRRLAAVGDAVRAAGALSVAEQLVFTVEADSHH